MCLVNVHGYLIKNCIEVYGCVHNHTYIHTYIHTIIHNVYIDTHAYLGMID